MKVERQAGRLVATDGFTSGGSAAAAPRNSGTPLDRDRGREGEREVWDVCSLVLESIICLNRMNDDGVNMKFGRLNHCLSECVGDCLYRSLSPPRSICLHLFLSLLVILMICFVLGLF